MRASRQTSGAAAGECFVSTGAGVAAFSGPGGASGYEFDMISHSDTFFLLFVF